MSEDYDAARTAKWIGLIVVFAGILWLVCLVGFAIVDAWEGDDGGLDQWEVTVGVYADRVNNQMQLTEPPAPPTTIPQPPAFSSANDGRTCFGAIPLLQYYSPGWDVNHFARIMWRESNCQPGARNSCCHGLLQIHWSAHRGWLDELGITSVDQLYNPVNNIRAAARLYRMDGTQPWEQTR